MKYLLLLLPLFAQSQNTNGFIVSPDALTTTPNLTIVDTRKDTFPPMFTFEPGGWTITEGSVVVRDCIPFEEFTEWKLELIGSIKIADMHEGPHDWVYAEHSDVNLSWIELQTAIYCPCGCPKTDNEARICRVCFVHQTRTRTYGHKPRVEESEYVKLKKKAKQ